MPAPSSPFAQEEQFTFWRASEMLSFGRKSILSLPKLTGKSLNRASSSSFLKFPSLFGSKTDSPEKSTVSQQETPGRKEYYVPRKFVPMTRKALIRRIVEDEVLVNTNDRHYFQGLAELLDKSIAGSFHGILGELKVGQYAQAAHTRTPQG